MDAQKGFRRAEPVNHVGFGHLFGNRGYQCFRKLLSPDVDQGEVRERLRLFVHDCPQVRGAEVHGGEAVLHPEFLQLDRVHQRVVVDDDDRDSVEDVRERRPVGVPRHRPVPEAVAPGHRRELLVVLARPRVFQVVAADELEPDRGRVLDALGLACAA